MNKFLLVLFVLLPLYSFTQEEKPFTVVFKVKTQHSGTDYPALVQNKNWNSSTTFEIDLTSNSNYGKVLSSGMRKGWAFFIQPSGAWGWNIGDGKSRMDYLPSSKQKINDGQWHELQCSFYLQEEAVRLYFDKKEVAIYNIGNLEVERLFIFDKIEANPTDSIQIKSLKTKEKSPKPLKLKDTPNELRVVNWNIWHGGRRNGITEGIEQTVQAIKAQNPDLVFLQETYGSGPIIADSLDMNFYLISSNLSIMTRFPIEKVFSPWDDFRFGGAVIRVGPEQVITALDVWLNYLPSTHQMIQDGAAYWELLEEEMKIRGREILNLFSEYKRLQNSHPTIMAGDFNSGSHLDWTLENAARYGGYFMPWPVSKTIYREGFTDTYRNVYPDSKKVIGFTWSPRFKDVLQYRIDYIYQDSNWTTLAAGVEGYDHPKWSSDHAMTWAILQLKTSIKP